MILTELVLDTAPDVREQMIALACQTTAATHREKGCVRYQFTTDIDLPNRFILTELWKAKTT